jgi:hypothetical protein
LSLQTVPLNLHSIRRRSLGLLDATTGFLYLLKKAVWNKSTEGRFPSEAWDHEKATKAFPLGLLRHWLRLHNHQEEAFLLGKKSVIWPEDDGDIRFVLFVTGGVPDVETSVDLSGPWHSLA